MGRTRFDQMNCGIGRALEAFGDWWTLLIVRDAFFGARRFSDEAIARAFRWRDMLEDGTHATITEIASAEKINQSYVCRILRLTLLAPDIIEAILDGRRPAARQLPILMQAFPVEWMSQRAALGS